MTFGGNGNYPAGGNPWNGTPVRVDPNYQYFTPGQKVSAQELNSIIGGIADQQPLAQTSVTHFEAQVLPTAGLGFSQLNTALWDRFRGFWLLGGKGGGGPYLMYNYGSDPALWAHDSLGALGLAGHTVVSMCVTPATGHYIAHTSDGAGQFYDWYSTNVGNTWTNITTFSSTSRASELVPFGNVVIYAVAGVGANGFLARYDTPEGVPAPISPTTVTGVTCFEWLLAVNNNVAVAIPRNTSSTTYYTSTDGIAWTTQTLPSFVAVSGEPPVAMTYNPTTKIFVLVVQPSGGGARVCTSADGVTWTVAGTLGAASSISFGTNYTFSDIAAAGNVLCGITNDTSTPAPQSALGTSRVLYSVDGGATWYWGSAALTNGVAATQRPRLYSAGGQLLALNSARVRLGVTSGLRTQNLV